MSLGLCVGFSGIYWHSYLFTALPYPLLASILGETALAMKCVYSGPLYRLNMAD